jgi:hypothetical protein
MKPFAILFPVVLAGATLGAQEPQNFFNAFVAGGPGQFEFRMPLSARTVKGAPYSAETISESAQTLSDGNRISQRTTGRVYRDGQGRIRREEDRPDGSQSVSIIDPVSGESYSLNSKTRVADKTPGAVGLSVMNKVAGGAVTTTTVEGAIGVITQEKFETQLKAMTEAMAKGAGMRKEYGRPAELHATETLAGRIIEGVRADGTRTTTTIAAGAIGNDLPIVITSEEWKSPDLQVLVLTQHSDPRSGESTYRLVNIVRAEPDASLFQVPPDYTLRDTGIRRERREQ